MEAVAPAAVGDPQTGVGAISQRVVPLTSGKS